MARRGPQREAPPPWLDLVPVKPTVLSVRSIARADEAILRQLGRALGGSGGLDPGAVNGLGVDRPSLGLITCTSDDALYVALDEGTKAADVEVVYARSFYAGAGYSSGPLSGEVIGIYAARDPAEIEAALAACRRCLADEAWFYAADPAGRLTFFPHVVRSTGSYLSRAAGIERGRPLAYLIAPPLESVVGLDAALKAAPVQLLKWFGPPSETNYGGAYLGGEIDDCESAAQAFASAVVDVGRYPLDAGRQARAAGELSHATRRFATAGAGPSAGPSLRGKKA